ncbi:FRG domain-containing protein [Fusobacterium nucleatum]|uniref:FRG domain-containing protein n=1 Tax=Fusobacterium nucleatum TaxID=851 RepID=UPI00040EBE3D|nr:FRG domain-containing protein [Fusobacterium nucleatum]ASG25901.1 FRG domain-containing protein [Fusobacterium nucleatum subsp. nucleatum]
MEEKIFNKDEIENYGIEITSVSSFIDEVNRLKEDLSGSNEELFFRGQKTDFWDVIPSVFRNNYLSVEHTLMQVPLLKAPYEFISINNDFEIMTKYQHYGMCTRLLDLTTNPLVALYFACEEYGDVCYKGIEDDEETKPQEANGVIFFNKRYPVSTSEMGIIIISALSQIDLSNDNTLESILKKLAERQAISKELEKRWQSQEYYEEFINIIQNNYIVTPSYNNERLLRQCGMFLLAGCFNFIYTKSISKSSIEKGYKDLRDEFDRKFFYILGENKKAILEELDTYNINEATLFPELEHQLSYIKNKKNAKTKVSSEFIKFDSNDIKTQIIKTDIEISDSIIKNENFKDTVLKDLSKKYNFDIQKIWALVEECVSTIDWNRQESVLSKFKVGVQRVFLENGFNKEDAKNESKYISDRILEIASELSEGSEK